MEKLTLHLHHFPVVAPVKQVVHVDASGGLGPGGGIERRGRMRQFLDESEAEFLGFGGGGRHQFDEVTDAGGDWIQGLDPDAVSSLHEVEFVGPLPADDSANADERIGLGPSGVPELGEGGRSEFRDDLAG